MVNQMRIAKQTPAVIFTGIPIGIIMEMYVQILMEFQKKLPYEAPWDLWAGWIFAPQSQSPRETILFSSESQLEI